MEFIMDLPFKRMVAAGLLSFASMSANAILIDNGNTIYDTASHLQWLNLTSTYGSVSGNGLTREQYESSNYMTSGEYRWATSAEVGDLFLNAYPDPLGDQSGLTLEYSEVANTINFMDLFGSRGYGGDVWRDVSTGYTLEGLAYIGLMGTDDYRYVEGDQYQFVTINSDYGCNTVDGCDLLTDVTFGAYLVKVDEPSTLALLCMGLVGLGYSRRKKKLEQI